MPIDPFDDHTSSSGDAKPTADDPKPPRRSHEQVGDRIGQYKLLQKLGEGGMGAVWQAEQLVPVRRHVAMKLIRPDLAADRFMARFEAERQALAMMDHPNISKMFDAGTTENGAPYLVMELVKGVPLTKYCDDARLTLRERVQLFLPVCRAVQHAHTKGIIHRDLKPSNILVAIYDGVAVPKIIDFGIAKALHQPLTEKTLVTEIGSMVGTPEYMAPEQAEFNALDIDTRADIYSLGTILYELLAGSTPFDRRKLEGFALLELLRLIKETDPPAPSKKLSSVDTLPDIAARRRTEPQKLGRLVRGELDWIVMKALEKERSRRYGTADLFAADLEHYLNDEAVLAGPPSAGYRLRKVWRRHQGRIVAVGLVVVALVGGLVAATTQAYRATNAEGRLEKSLGDLQIVVSERQLALNQAVEQTNEAKKQKAIAEGQTTDLRRELAFGRYTMARMAIEQNSGESALAYLDDVPRPYRNVEWGLMRRQILGERLGYFLETPTAEVLSPDSRECAAILSGRVRALDLATGVERKTQFKAHPGLLGAIAYGPNGIRVAAPMMDKSVQVWDEGESLGLKFQRLPGVPSSLKMTSDGRRLAAACDDGSVVAFDLVSNKRSPVIQCGKDLVPGMFSPISISADGRRIFAKLQVGENEAMHQFDFDSGKEVPMVDGINKQVAVSPDGKYCICDEDKGRITIRSSTDGQVASTIRVGAANWVMGINPEGHLVTWCLADRTIRTWTIPEAHELENSRSFWRLLNDPMLFSADGRNYFFQQGRTVRVFPIDGRSTGGHRFTYRSRSGAGIVSPNGRLILHDSIEGEIHVRDIATEQDLCTFRGHEGTMGAVTMSQDGTRAATNSIDKSVRIWDTATGQCVQTLKDTALQKDDLFHAAALSSDGRQAHLDEKQVAIMECEERQSNPRDGRPH